MRKYNILWDIAEFEIGYVDGASFPYLYDYIKGEDND
jgi:hypothetical protein